MEKSKLKGHQVICSAFIEKDNKFLIVMCPRFKVWRVPGGRAEHGEKLEETLLREVTSSITLKYEAFGFSTKALLEVVPTLILSPKVKNTMVLKSTSGTSSAGLQRVVNSFLSLTHKGRKLLGLIRRHIPLRPSLSPGTCQSNDIIRDVKVLLKCYANMSSVHWKNGE